MDVPWVTEYAVWGGVGGLITVLAKQGYFELPYRKDRRIYIGSLTGIVFGVLAGLIGDSSSFNAFLWGAGGTTIIQGIVNVAESGAAALSKKKTNGG